MKKLLFLIAFLIVNFAIAQNNSTVGTLRARSIVPLSSIAGLQPAYENDTILNLYYGYAGDSLIYVNDTTLIDWLGEHGGGTPGGSSGQLQYNNGGSFGGTAGFSFDGTNLIGTAGYFQQEKVILDGNNVTTNAEGLDLSGANGIVRIEATSNLILLSGELDFGNSQTAGSTRPLSAVGTDPNIGFNFVTKGTGSAQSVGGFVMPVSPTGTLNGLLRYDNSASAILEVYDDGLGAWQPIGGGGAPAGAGTELQYNNAGVFGAISGSSYDGTNLVTGAGTVRLGNWRFSASTVVNTGGGDLTMGQNFTPSVNTSFDLGAAGLYWRNLYVDNAINGSATGLDFNVNGTSGYEFQVNTTPYMYIDAATSGGLSFANGISVRIPATVTTTGNGTLRYDNGGNQFLQVYDATDAGWKTIGGGTSGTYTPTLSASTNIASSTIQTGSSTYIRIGDIITVSGYIVVNTTSTGNFTFNLTLPVASILTNEWELSGVGQVTLGTTYNNIPVRIIAHTGSNLAAFQSESEEALVNGILTYSFQYQVL